MKEEEVKSIVRQLCEGVAGMHRLGIYHRDLKPRNVVHDKNRVIKWIDFGTAYDERNSNWLDNYEEAKRRYKLPGTPEYAPLELFIGSEQNVTLHIRTDAFALGVTIFEVVTGKRWTDLVYDRPVLDQVQRVFWNVKDDTQRVFEFHKVLTRLCQMWPVPDLREHSRYSGQWVNDLNVLYRGLTALDYRHRIVDVTSVAEELRNWG